MPEQRPEDIHRQARAQASGSVDRKLQGRSGKCRSCNQIRHRLRSVTAADRGKRFERGRLLGHQAIHSETRKALAQVGKGGNGRTQLPAGRFGGKLPAFGKPRLREGFDQRLVVHLRGRKRRLRALGHEIIEPSAGIPE
jgi:hypothetical protein